MAPTSADWTFMTSNLLAAIKKVSVSASIYNASKDAIRSSTPAGIGIIGSLKSLQRELKNYLSSIDSKLTVSISKGQSNIPRILYVAISRTSDRLSTEPSVCICFEESGKGFVVGMMYPMSYLKTTKFPKVKREKETLKVDLSSKRSKSNFNNLFVNPLEMIVDEASEDLLVQHIADSIVLLEQEIAHVN